MLAQVPFPHSFKKGRRRSGPVIDFCEILPGELCESLQPLADG
jgi:hypothetical protein